MSFDLRSVSFAYGAGIPALNNLSLTIAEGERVALLGANGSGKSTLLRLLAGLGFAGEGSVTAFGQPLTEDAFADDAFNHEFRKRVGVVFQNPDIQLFNPTVFDELAFGPLQLGWPAKDVLTAIKTALHQFGINHLRERPPHRLSGGEKKRVALASVWITQPQVLLLDEPTNALDPESRTAVVSLLNTFAAAGHGLITATHDLDIVQAIATRAIVLASGQVAADGPARAILQDTELLRRTHLLQSHWHTSPDGQVQAHHHDHRHSPTDSAPDFTLKTSFTP